ncbi:MAG: CAP domain-containing protein [Bacteroidia bacterium]|nr:CAP domain-containing protein [Bacteroidia bacterium]
MRLLLSFIMLLVVWSFQSKQTKNTLDFKNISVLIEHSDFSAASNQINKALEAQPNNTQFLSLKREIVIRDYKKNYLLDTLGSYNSLFSKLPGNCLSGTLTEKTQKVIINRINYFRRLAGVYDSCSLDPILNEKAQKAAFMMHVNSTLNHEPPSTWKCYTKDGAYAAGRSNLSLGYGFLDALRGQMDDEGKSNDACGHRRWILNPNNKRFGHGSTNEAMCLYVVDTDVKGLYRLNFNDDQFVVWPSAYHFPIDLLPERWSFSLSNAEFKNAKVSVTLNGKKQTISKEKVYVGYAQNTLVWKMQSPIITEGTYTVTVSDVSVYDKVNMKTMSKSFTYKVIPIKISK